MRLGRLFARVATVTGAVALFAGSLLVAQLAVADGQEGRQVRPPRPAQQQQTYAPPTSPDVPELAGANPTPMTPAATAAGDGCISLESAYRAISETTQSADIASINAALDEVNRDPTGMSSGASASPLAARLRTALGLSSSSPPCETVLAALRDSAQLAQLASAAEPEGPVTGAVGDPPPTSPSYRVVQTGTPTGSGGHGYCVHLSNGCSI